jgi:hypothetical protein
MFEKGIHDLIADAFAAQSLRQSGFNDPALVAAQTIGAGPAFLHGQQGQDHVLLTRSGGQPRTSCKVFSSCCSIKFISAY